MLSSGRSLRKAATSCDGVSLPTWEACSLWTVPTEEGCGRQIGRPQNPSICLKAWQSSEASPLMSNLLPGSCTPPPTSHKLHRVALCVSSHVCTAGECTCIHMCGEGNLKHLRCLPPFVGEGLLLAWNSVNRAGLLGEKLQDPGVLPPTGCRWDCTCSYTDPHIVFYMGSGDEFWSSHF